jgi:hypothetical protein
MADQDAGMMNFWTWSFSGEEPADKLRGRKMPKCRVNGTTINYEPERVYGRPNGARIQRYFLEGRRYQCAP